MPRTGSLCANVRTLLYKIKPPVSRRGVARLAWTHGDGQGLPGVECVDAQLGHTVLLGQGLHVGALGHHRDVAGRGAVGVRHEHLWVQARWRGFRQT